MNATLKFGLPILLGAAFSVPSAHAAGSEVTIITGLLSGTCDPTNTVAAQFLFGAANLPGTLSNILTNGDFGTCQSDDKKYIFKFANAANQNATAANPYAFLETDRFEIKNSGLVHTLVVTPTVGEVFTPANPLGINTGTYQLKYDVLITSDLNYDAYATTLSASPIVNTSINAVKTLTETTFGKVCSTVNGTCGTDPQGKIVAGGKLFQFDSQLVLTGGYVDAGTGATAFDDTIRQTATVPGPLPILGALSAFGFSRKIRKRYKLA